MTDPNLSIDEHDRRPGVDPTHRQIVGGYAELVSDRVRARWSCHLVTFLFTQFAGPRSVVIGGMRDEIERFYSTLVTRVHRKPRAASPDELPVLIGAADLPVHKRAPCSSPLSLCNGGLHFHAVLLIPPGSRLREPVDEHFSANDDLYRGRAGRVGSIHVRPVTDGHGRVVDYVFKTILRRRISYDDGCLLLPRTKNELVSTTSAAVDI